MGAILSIWTDVGERAIVAEGSVVKANQAVPAGMVVAGELSLGAATRRDKETGKNEWVDAHERLGRNR